MSTLERPLMDRTRFITLAGDVLSGAGDLAKAHGEQLRQEVRQNTTKCTTAGAMLAVGGVIAMLGVVALMVTLAFGLMAAFGWSPLAAWGTVAAFMLVVGIGLALLGLLQMKQVRFVPAESLQSIQESLQWLTRR